MATSGFAGQRCPARSSMLSRSSTGARLGCGLRVATGISSRSVLARADKTYAMEIADDAYICLGLAQCFRKAGGSLQPIAIVEPMSASSLECLANEAPFCENYEYRCEAAARTWLRPHAQDNLMDIVPLGKVRGNFNFSLEDKRVLNMDNVVNDSDNIKQDMSIDVYGRKKEEDKAAKQQAQDVAKAAEDAAVAKKLKEEEDLDMLLLA